MIIVPVVQVALEVVEDFAASQRGAGGFGTRALAELTRSPIANCYFGALAWVDAAAADVPQFLDRLMSASYAATTFRCSVCLTARLNSACAAHSWRDHFLGEIVGHAAARRASCCTARS